MSGLSGSPDDRINICVVRLFKHKRAPYQQELAITLKNGENYNAELYRKSDIPAADRQQLYNLNIPNIQFLKQPPKDGLFVVRLRGWIPSTFHFQP